MTQQQPVYSVCLEFFDHQGVVSSSSPLHPKTSTHLPLALDRKLKKEGERLVLPQSFWQTLPPSRQLDTVPVPVQPPTAERPPLPRIWTEPAWSPPPGTLDLPPISASVPTKQKPTLDFRFGPLALEWVDNPHPRPPMSPTLASSSASPGPSSQRLGSSPQPAPRQVTSKSPDNRPPETSGMTELYWGTVHLYRESGSDSEPSTLAEKRAAVNSDDGTVVGMISVPGNVSAAALLTFITPALDAVAQLRVLRDSTPNRSMVLIKFKEATEAAEFTRMFNGKPYHDTKDVRALPPPPLALHSQLDPVQSEICHVVSISAIKLKTTTSPPFSFPYSPDLDADTQSSSAVELPTCAVCLERMDGNVSGLITVLCQHSFHCNCLLKWGDSRCPICRSTNIRTRSKTVSSAAPPLRHFCSVCNSDSNLWICLICGNVGCGRYQGGHAHSHFEESRHTYALELETERIWDYDGDAYIHRLIRNRQDGSLVELPTINKGDEEKEKDKDKESKRGPDRDAEESQDKLEAIGQQYSIIMTQQLSSQRDYYEQELAVKKEESSMMKRRLDELEAGLDKSVGQMNAWKKERLDWEKEKLDLENKLVDAAKVQKKEQTEAGEESARWRKERQEFAKTKKELERLLADEKTVTASLTENLGHLRLEIRKQEEETKGVRAEVEDLREQMRDVMFALSARDKIEAEGGAANEAVGGDVSLPPPPATPTRSPASRGKGRKKR